MKNETKILIADDHTLIRKGLKQVLEGREDYEVFEAENGEEAWELIQQENPQVAILDIEMPKLSGYELVVKLQGKGTALKVIFLTMYKDESMFNKAMDLGVNGYVLKENTVSEILQGVETVLEGKHYLSPAISDLLIRRTAAKKAGATTKNLLDDLTSSELNILRLLSAMKTNQEMAEELGISIKTVQNHRNNICNKLDISGTHALLKFAVEHENQL